MDFVDFSFSIHTNPSRSRQALASEYFIETIVVDTAENGQWKVWGMKMGVQVMNEVHQLMTEVYHLMSLMTRFNCNIGRG